VPFTVGILVRHWTEDRALEWNQFAAKVSGSTFLVVIALAILGSWQTIIDLIGSRTLIAGVVFSVAAIIAGYFISHGGPSTRRATGLVVPGSNAGPASAAVAIAFNNDPTILGAVSAITLIQIIVVMLVASYLGKTEDQSEIADATTPHDAPARPTPRRAPPPHERITGVASRGHCNGSDVLGCVAYLWAPLPRRWWWLVGWWTLIRGRFDRGWTWIARALRGGCRSRCSG